MVRMRGAEALGDEDFDRLADQFLAHIAKETLRLSIDEHDAPVLADDYHRIRRGVQQPAHFRSARPIVTEAPDGGYVSDMRSNKLNRSLIFPNPSHRHGDMQARTAVFLSDCL